MRTCSASRGKYSAIGRPFTRIWPVPRRRRTRATALLRRPVARMNVASAKAQLLRLLGGVRMVRTPVDLELAEHRAAERVLRQHQAHRVAQDAIGVRSLEQLAGRRLLQVAGVPGVAPVGLLLA